jgi:hypothetical protein
VIGLDCLKDLGADLLPEILAFTLELQATERLPGSEF